MSGARVLVAEKVGASGIELLEQHFDVEIGFDWDREQVKERLPEFDGILIRSATKLDAELLEAGTKLKVIGRAGVGVDKRRCSRGQQARHRRRERATLQCRHGGRTHIGAAARARAERTAGARLADRRALGPLEVLGRRALREDARHTRLSGASGSSSSERARGFRMRVIAYDPVVSAERYRELGVERAESPEDVYAAADFLTLHLPNTPETAGWLNAAVLAQCKDGVRVLNVARGPLVVDADLQAALDSGKVAGAALDVFQSEPITDHPLFGYPNVIVTPHLGASTAEANDRARLPGG